MNLENDVIQYYIQNDPILAERYELYEIMLEDQIHLILKRMNMDMANIFRQLGKHQKADLIKNCNSLRYIKQCLVHPEHKEMKVSYCKDRYCPICSHLKAHKQTEMLHTILESMQKDNNYKNSYLIFITLTQKNVPADELKDLVNKTTKALTKVMKSDALFKSYSTTKKGKKTKNKALCQGAVVKKECTANYHPEVKSMLFNPHIHMILMVRKDYWNQKHRQWTHKKLGQIWKEALELDYTPVVWISLVRNGELVSSIEEEYFEEIDPKEAKKQKNNLANLDSSGALKEIGKYEAKESDLLQISKDKDGNLAINYSDARIVVGAMYGAYNGKQTLTFTGEFRKQKLRLFGNQEAEDLIEDIDGEELIDLFKRKTCKKCGGPVEEQLQRYGGKTKVYYRLGDGALRDYKKAENDRINSIALARKDKKAQKNTDVTNHENISIKHKPNDIDIIPAPIDDGTLPFQFDNI